MSCVFFYFKKKLNTLVGRFWPLGHMFHTPDVQMSVMLLNLMVVV